MKFLFYFSLPLLIIQLAACSGLRTRPKDGPPRYYKDVNQIPNAVPKSQPRSRYGNPRSYSVLGHRYYVLKTAKNYKQVGYASWYGRKFSGQRTSSGEPYNPYAMTGASKVLPIPTYVKVTNLENGRSIIVKINDRGPFHTNRIIDLSYAGATKLGYIHHGTALVRVAAINPQRPQRKEIPTDQNIVHHSPKAFLQAGAFTHYNNARQLEERLRQFVRTHVRIAIHRHHRQPLYCVQIGPLHNDKQADRIQQVLTKHGLPQAIAVTG